MYEQFKCPQNLKLSGNVQVTWSVLNCKKYITIINITQFFHLRHNSKRQVVFWGLLQIYFPEDDFIAKI